MKVNELRNILGNMRKFCESAGAKTAAKDLQVFSDMLKPYADADVGNACASIRQSLSQGAQKPQKRGKTPGGAATAALNESAIQHHLTELRNAGSDKDAFYLAFENLKGSKSVKLPDLAEIARQFSRQSMTSCRSKAAAHSEIENAFIRQVRFEKKVG